MTKKTKEGSKAQTALPSVESEPIAEPKRIEVKDMSCDRNALNIHQRMLAIMSAVRAIEKSGHNDTHNYNFIEQAAVLAELRSKLAQYGVMIWQSVKTHNLTQKAKGWKAVVTYEFDFVNVDNPEDHRLVEWVGEGDDSLDKGTNKAATAAEKYMLMKAFKISDKNDPDGDAASANEQSLPYGLERRSPNATINRKEREILYRAMFKQGMAGDDQIEVLRANGADPDAMTHSMVIMMLDKLSKRSLVFPPPPPSGTLDTPVEVDENTDMDTEITTALNKMESEVPPPAAPAVLPPLVVDDDMKSYVASEYENLYLSKRGRMWFMRTLVGRPWADLTSFTNDDEWRKAYEFIQDITDGKINVPVEYYADTHTNDSSGTEEASPAKATED